MPAGPLGRTIGWPRVACRRIFRSISPVVDRLSSSFGEAVLRGQPEQDMTQVICQSKPFSETKLVNNN